ncbi:unnamed protein product [Phaedon cochleariae]|uniref:Uncharacterized protein n=1 Tax=Phaedon cochleariae TaxID=80249 RepID=A0A9P0GSS6_PHACE|nr:unnamed protein product [Phaedon cochleariae]
MRLSVSERFSGLGEVPDDLKMDSLSVKSVLSVAPTSQGPCSLLGGRNEEPPRRKNHSRSSTKSRSRSPSAQESSSVSANKEQPSCSKSADVPHAVASTVRPKIPLSNENPNQFQTWWLSSPFHTKAQNTPDGINIFRDGRDSLRALTKLLNEFSAPYHTYQLPSVKDLQVVIRGQSEDIQMRFVEKNLKDRGFSVTSPHLMKKRDGTLMPLVDAILPETYDSKEIYSIRDLVKLTSKCKKPRKDK